MSSLYLHIPYCVRKCGYCDFFSLAPVSAAELENYVQLLLSELEQLRQQISLEPLQTVFFGGGTPSLLSAEQVETLLGALEAAFGFSDDCEISLEGNPGSLTPDKLAGYIEAGVNRLSIGVQSLSDEHLQQLGRSHTADQARQAVRMARAAGFDNLSLDLMFALPGQSLPQLREDVAAVLELQPQHLSIYGLTFEPQTPFYEQLQAGELPEPDESNYADAYLLIDQLLRSAGYLHYEISNFARPGFRCHHNLNYWQRQSSFALGCGAHSFLARNWGERWHVPADLARYQSKLQSGEPVAERLEVFDRRGAMSETLYLALRTQDGLAKEQFAATFGVAPEDEFAAAFARCRGHLRDEAGHWRLDLQGWLLYDHLISYFL